MLVAEGTELSDEELLTEYNGDIINQWHYIISFQGFKELRKNYKSINYGRINSKYETSRNKIIKNNKSKKT